MVGVGQLVAVALVLSLASPVSGKDATPESAFQGGGEAFGRGAFEEAVARFREAARLAEQAGQVGRQITALTHMADALSALGRYPRAAESLEQALRLAERAGDSRQAVAIQAGLGNLQVAMGPPAAAETHLRRTLAAARDLGDDTLTAVILNNLGNALATQGNETAAASAYRESASLSRRLGRPAAEARALANGAAALRRVGEPGEARRLLDRAREALRGLGPAHGAAVVLVNLGLEYRELRSAFPAEAEALLLEAAAALREAATTAEQVRDRRTLSYAWGHLATMYAAEGRAQEALELTHRAIFAAQRAGAPESLYRWQAHAGRLLARLGRRDEALAAYRRAVRTLQAVRPELAAPYGADQPFRATVGPIYFELVDLLLRESAGPRTRGEQEALLAEARETVESFKVAELRDYFRDDCVDTALAKATRLDVVSRTAVVVYPILLPDRIELLLSLPPGLERVSVPVPATAVTEEVRKLRHTLEKRTTRQYLPHAQQLYAWLIRPLEPHLASWPVDTLVFVPDGPLRTIPMAALHDGRRFLVERYAVGVTPGLSLTDPRPLTREAARVLAVGVTEPVQGYPPLPNVSAELEALQRLFGGTVLVNQDFRVGALERKLRDERFTIVHIASHGQFGSEPKDTFVLAFDERLTIDRLDQMVGLLRFRDDPLELLTLSACDTAAGDDRAALGLAGVAIKAGARSALATLWQISDEASAELVAEFYRQLQDPGASRATALRRAQLRLLTDPRWDHPGFWSAFLLINNWL